VALSVALGARHINDDVRDRVRGGRFVDDGAVRVEELVGDIGENGGPARGDAALVTKTSRRARNWRMSAPEENSESSGSKSAERSSESFGEGERGRPAATCRL
jgi:hypothetical protein